MLPVILPRPCGIEQLIVFRHQVLPPVWVTEYPVLKGFPYGVLLLRRKGGFLLVQYPLFLPVLHNRVIYPAVF